MIRTKGRRRLTCFHEAGHCLARWYFGYPIERVVVLTVEQVRAGVRIRNPRGELVTCEGMVVANSIDRGLPPKTSRISRATGSRLLSLQPR
jgi:hypothetical protein